MHRGFPYVTGRLRWLCLASVGDLSASPAIKLLTTQPTWSLQWAAAMALP
jgi:hypothetical protein